MAKTIILNKGDSIMEGLKKWYKENAKEGQIWHVNSIGACEDPTIGFLKEPGVYIWKEMKGEWEILSAQGTISKDDEGNIVPHIHIMISGEDMVTYGGHLKDGIISITLEMMATSCEVQKGYREYDEVTKLKLIKTK